MMTLTRLAMLSLALIGGSVRAATYDFSYAADAGIVSGRFAGTLPGDGNTVFVDTFYYAAFDGVRGVALPLLTTASGIYGVDRQPLLTFDGSRLDVAFCTDENCADGVLFDPDVIDIAPVVSTGASYGEVREFSDPSRFSLSLVPEPASWGLMIAGFAAVGVAARRRAALVTA